MTNFQKHYNAGYNLDNIPKTDNYDELCFIVNYGLGNGFYPQLPGKYCGDKVNNLLIKWGYQQTQYEIY